MIKAPHELLVRNLPQDIDGEFFIDFFGEYGLIKEYVCIMDDLVESSRCAFLHFETEDGMKRAMNKFNYTKQKEKTIRIVESSTEIRNLAKRGKTIIVITGLDNELEVSQLHKTFANYGEVVCCDIPINKMGWSERYGFVMFRRIEDAEKVMNDSQSSFFEGKKIKIYNCIDSDPNNFEQAFNNVFIKKLPKDRFKNDEDVKKFFESHGVRVRSATLMKNEFGKSLKTGFCDIIDHGDFKRAIVELNGKDIFGKGDKLTMVCAMNEIDGMVALKRQEKLFSRMNKIETRGRKLFVNNFGEDITDEEFKEFFGKFGEVECAYISRDPDNNNKSKGKGYVLYKDKEGANQAIETTTMEKLGGSIPYITLCIPKKVLKARQEYIRYNETVGKEINPKNLVGKDKLHYYLTWEYGVTGSDLEFLLTGVNDEKAKQLAKNEQNIDEWCNLPCYSRYIYGIEKNAPTQDYCSYAKYHLLNILYLG